MWKLVREWQEKKCGCRQAPGATDEASYEHDGHKLYALVDSG